METNTGRMTVISLNDEPAPRLDMIWTMINPTTSSIIAALVSTTPKRLSVSPLVARTVNVVPKDVEHSAAPAANACTGESGRRPRRTKEMPIGAAIPVRATAEDKKRFAFKAFKLLEMPPESILADVARSVERMLVLLTFIHNEDQPQVTQLNN